MRSPLVDGLPRPLSALEQMFWLADQHRPNHFCVAAEVVGARSPAAWQAAARAVLADVPLAGCTVVPGPDGRPWFRAGAAPTLAVAAGNASNWPQVVADQLARPTLGHPPGDHGPVIRATLVHEPQRAALVLTAHHAAADGLGLTYLLRDVLRTVGGERVHRPDTVISTEARVRGRGGVRPPAALGPPPAAVPYRPYDPDVRVPPRVAVASLSADETARLRRCAHDQGTTVHAVVSVALARSLQWSRPGPGVVRVLSPVDLRRRLLDGTQHLGLCVLAAPSAVACDNRAAGSATGENPDEFWSEVRRFADSLAPFRDPEFLRANLSTVEQLAPAITTPDAAAHVFATVYGCDLLVTNLGVVDVPDRFGDLALAGLWGPAVTLGFAGEQAVGVATVGDCLRLLHTSYAPVPSLLERALRTIRAL